MLALGSAITCGFAAEPIWIWSQRERALARLAKLHCSQAYFGPVLGLGSNSLEHEPHWCHKKAQATQAIQL